MDNATERLTATYVDGKEVDIGRGGEPSTQDLCRKLMAVELMGGDKRSPGLLNRIYSTFVCGADRASSLCFLHVLGHPSTGFMLPAGILAAVLPVIRQIANLLQKDPDPDAVAKAGANHCSARCCSAP